MRRGKKGPEVQHKCGKKTSSRWCQLLVASELPPGASPCAGHGLSWLWFGNFVWLLAHSLPNPTQIPLERSSRTGWKWDKIGVGCGGIRTSFLSSLQYQVCSIGASLLFSISFPVCSYQSGAKKPVRNGNENRIWLSSKLSFTEFVKSLQKTPEQGKSWFKKILMCCSCFSAPLNTKIFPEGFKNIKLPKNPL